MVVYEYWDVGNLHFVRATEPFKLDQLYQLGLDAIEQGGKAAEFWRPTLFDFRKVNLLQFESQDFRLLIEKRKAFGEKHNNNLAAYIVGDTGSFGMARMNNIYAEIAGLRDEDQTLVTMDVIEAVHWFIPRLKINQAQAAELVQLIG